MAKNTAASNAVTQYNVVLETPSKVGSELPALTLMLTEDRSGGWSGTLRMNPRQASPEQALQALLGDGLKPGTAVTVKLRISGNTGHTGTVVRAWPSVVTSVNATRGTDPDALCVVSFRDPLSFLRNRSVWTAFVDCPLGEVLGGVLSCAAGGDGKPSRHPVLPGLPTVTVREELRGELATLPYAIAAGEPLGYWLNRVCGRLGTRLEMLGNPEGTLDIWLRDGRPTEAVVNRDGGVDMTFDPAREPSAANLNLAQLETRAPQTLRGGMLDNLAGGGANRFGAPGALESVLTESELSLEEAARRGGFRHANQGLGQTAAYVLSCQPGLLPGRIVNIVSDREEDDTSGSSSGGEDDADKAGYESILGARRWQVADAAHVCIEGRYWNRCALAKTGVPWRPRPPPEHGAVVVTGVVDDGSSAFGELIERDRMGRIPVRFPFVHVPQPDDEAPALPTAADVQWPPSLPLAPVAPGAGNLHGFVSDHRQGDSCKVAVVSPLYAEIIGFSHRDNRYLGTNVRDATLGIVVREDSDEWRGVLFRPDEDLGDETGPDTDA